MSAAVPELLNLVDALRWCGRCWLVKVGLDRDGVARRVVVVPVVPPHDGGADGGDMAHAALAITTALDGGADLGTLAATWPEQDGKAVGQLIAVAQRIEARGGDIVRFAHKAARERVAGEQVS